MKLPALSGLFHNLIICCSLHLLNVQLQAFACDTSLNHNYNNYVPERRSMKTPSEMTWELGGWQAPTWAVGCFHVSDGRQGRNGFQMPKENISWACLGKTFNAFQEVPGFWGRKPILQPANSGDWPFEQQNDHPYAFEDLEAGQKTPVCTVVWPCEWCTALTLWGAY